MSDKDGNKLKGVQAFSLIIQLGISMLVPIFLCFMLGTFIYRRVGLVWPLCVLTVLGIAAAFNGCWRLIRKMFLTDDKSSEKT